MQNNIKFLNIFWSENLAGSGKDINFASQKRTKGSMSEWLGTGLQNRLHQFESGWNLFLNPHQ